MARIKTDKWKPSLDNPGRRVYDGQRTARKVFDDLEAHLTSVGYLPDEYFLFDDSRWGNGREFPSDGYLTNRVDYGGSEGIYLDVTLEHHENGEHIYEHFATGKTLGESGNDLDRMNLIASAITKAFHEDGVHARYITVGSSHASEGITVNLNPEERRVAVSSLTQLHKNLTPDNPSYTLTDQLLNRIGDGIIEQEQIEETHDLPAIIFSRVRLWTDTGEDCEFFMGGVPTSYDDLEDNEDYIDFGEFVEQLSTGHSKEITAYITTFSEGDGEPQPASQADIDRIYNAIADVDIDTITGWTWIGENSFTFDYDIDELFHMKGIE